MHRKPLIETQTYLKCSYPEPNIINSKYRGKSSEGLKCTLHAARQSSVQNKWQLNPQANKSFSRILYSIFPKATNSSNWTEGYMGSSGSVLRYQPSPTEPNFKVITDFLAL